MSGDPAAASEYLRSGERGRIRLGRRGAAGGAERGRPRQAPARPRYGTAAGRLLERTGSLLALVLPSVRGHRWRSRPCVDGCVASGGRSALVLPLVLFLGLALPLLLTSRVHIGRLLPALPVCVAARRGWSMDRRRVDWRACSPRREWRARDGALDRAGPGWRAPGTGGGRGAGRHGDAALSHAGVAHGSRRWRTGTRT